MAGTCPVVKRLWDRVEGKEAKERNKNRIKWDVCDGRLIHLKAIRGACVKKRGEVSNTSFFLVVVLFPIQCREVSFLNVLCCVLFSESI